VKSLRRLYDWVLSWADTPYGAPALFLISFAESSFFPIPPDVLLIALCLGARDKWLKFASICTAGSLLGGAFGYAIGWGFWHSVDDLFFKYIPSFTPEVFERVQEIYQQWDFWFVFLAGFTPIPYKVITITAGVFGLNFITFLIASFVGRAARFFLVAFLLYQVGEPIRDFIDKRFNLVVTVFAFLLFGGFYVVKFVL
jgi:membrane protein YqaA with SNARE-associated domain